MRLFVGHVVNVSAGISPGAFRLFLPKDSIQKNSQATLILVAFNLLKKTNPFVAEKYLPSNLTLCISGSSRNLYTKYHKKTTT